jgi:hypothetical protein
MHHLYYLAIFPVTGLTVAGYVTLYCANNSQGRMRTVGKILSGWAFLLAILVVAAAVIHPAMGDRPFGPGGHFGHMGDGSMLDRGMMDRGIPGDDTAPPPPTPDTPPPPASAPESSPSPSTGWKTQ